MKLSQFTVVLNDYPEIDHHLLYHTLSRSLIEVDKGGWDMLQNLSTDTPHRCRGFNLLQGTSDARVYR